MSKYSDARRIVAKVNEEEKNWRSAMPLLDELLEAADSAEKVVADVEARRATLEANIERLKKEEKQYNERVMVVREKLDGFETELAANERDKSGRLATLDAEIKVKEEHLASIDAQLAKLAASLAKG